jgi:hypothetical protein
MRLNHRAQLALIVCVLTTGCVSMRPPQVDQVYFQPLPASERTIDPVRLKWLIREDGYKFCSRITGVPITPTSRPMACAYWNVIRKECTIVTPTITGFNYIGHELRHCFEGAFHG